MIDTSVYPCPILSDLIEIPHVETMKGQSLTIPPINQQLLQHAFI